MINRAKAFAMSACPSGSFRPLPATPVDPLSSRRYFAHSLDYRNVPHDWRRTAIRLALTTAKGEERNMDRR